ncbi:hypothetical protein [Mycolicibacterium moriokaense]|nr:hypothetical protein [Mycolicibacterium moriokaense]MCV7038731.1 hypothetical protein [Mycolicibacterium moriokaense]
MFGSSRTRIPMSTWLRVSVATVVLAATAVLSSGCIPVVAEVVVVPVPAAV